MRTAKRWGSLERALMLADGLPPSRDTARLQLRLLTALPAPLVAVAGYGMHRLAQIHERARRLADQLGVELAPPLAWSMALAALVRGEWDTDTGSDSNCAPMPSTPMTRSYGWRVITSWALPPTGRGAWWRPAFFSKRRWRASSPSVAARTCCASDRTWNSSSGFDWLTHSGSSVTGAKPTANATSPLRRYRTPLTPTAARLRTCGLRSSRLIAATSPSSAGTWTPSGPTRPTRHQVRSACRSSCLGVISTCSRAAKTGASNACGVCKRNWWRLHSRLGSPASLRASCLRPARWRGEPELGLALADEALGMGRGADLWEAEIRRLRAICLAVLGGSDQEVRGELERALAVARRRGARAFEERIRGTLAERGLSHHRVP
jgi:hypothetical protein